MENYHVVFSSRAVGAIGEFEQSSCVHFCENAKEAYNLTRQALYAANREHVQILEITCDYTGAGEYTKVEPTAYLY
jgi:hypothetical protein